MIHTKNTEHQYTPWGTEHPTLNDLFETAVNTQDVNLKGFDILDALDNSRLLPS